MLGKLYQIQEKVNTGVIRAGIILGTLSAPFIDTVDVFAKTKAADPGDLGFLGDTASNNGTFDGITTTAQQTGYSFYRLLMVLGVIGLICSLVALGISYAFTKNANKKSENKSHLVDVCIGAIIVFGAMSIIGLVKGVAANI